MRGTGARWGVWGPGTSSHLPASTYLVLGGCRDCSAIRIRARNGAENGEQTLVLVSDVTSQLTRLRNKVKRARGFNPGLIPTSLFLTYHVCSHTKSLYNVLHVKTSFPFSSTKNSLEPGSG